MPDQILPLNGLDQAGLVLDAPPVSIPPNAYSDARNVRFRHGAIRKMEGEVNLFPSIFDTMSTNGIATNKNEELKYVVWWPNPNLADNLRGYYVVITEDKTRNKDIAYIILPGVNGFDTDSKVEKGEFSPAPAEAWQHTFFQGGYALIINNGIDPPAYILDIDGNEDIDEVPNFAPLPGWESYNVRETALEDTFTSVSSRIFDLNRAVNFSTETVVVEDITDSSRIITYSPVDGSNSDNLINGTDSERMSQQLLAVPSTDGGIPDANIDSEEFQLFISGPRPVQYVGIGNISLAIGNKTNLIGRRFRVSVQSRAQVQTTAGVVRAFGDFLVAGNLLEVDSEQPVFLADGSVNPNRVIRNLPSVVRTSDVATPGNIPTNWNPFAAGVSTADEFVVSDTGIVQDLVELQGNLYLYSNKSISALRRTGNAQVPFASSPVTDAYGAQTTGAVLEFDGKHFVVGSEDIYLFGGHPGSIQSVADHKVREFFFDDLNPLYETNLFCLRYQQKDEIWVCYPTTASIAGECNRALIWNYRNNTWTLRDLRNVVSGDVGPVPGGGIPGAFIELSGEAGNSGIDALGTDEIQTLVIDSEFSVPSGVHAGTFHESEITIDNQGQSFPSFVSRGPLFHDVIIGPNFNSGQGSTQVTPLAFTFTLFQEDNTFSTGFPFRVILDSDTTTAQSVKTQLLQDTEFNQYYDIINTDTDSHFVITTRNLPGILTRSDDGSFSNYIYPQYANGTVTIGGVVLSDSGTRDTLDRDTECDIQAPNNGQFVNSSSGGENIRSYSFSAFVQPTCLNRLYFVDVMGTNVDSENISLQVQINPAGSNTLMYGPEDPVNFSGDMYGAGRGGITNRPNRNPAAAGTDSELNAQDFYQDAFPSTQSVTLPWQPSLSGAHSFVVNVPGTGGSLPTYLAANVQLSAYEVPPPAESNQDLSIATRTSRPNLDNAITAPLIKFNTGHYAYNTDTHQFDKNTDSEVIVAFYGNFLVSELDRADEIAMYVRDAFNAQAGNIWTADVEEIGVNGKVNLMSTARRRQFIEISEIQSPLLASDFSIVDSEIGFTPIDSDSSQYPRFAITGPGFDTEMILQLVHDTAITTPSQMIQQIIDFIRNNDSDGANWGPPDAVALNDSDSERWRAVQKNENIPVEGSWAVRVESVGNTGLTLDSDDISGGLTYFNPQVVNSRVVRGSQNSGVINVNGVPVTIGVGDVRGSVFSRATPTLFAIRIRNTSVPTGQELILLSAADVTTTETNLANNNIRLTAPEVLQGHVVTNLNHVGWIETLRLASRRMDIQYAPGASSFRIVPVNYDDLATFALEIVMNDTQVGADRIQELWDMTQAGTLDLNPYSITQLPQETGLVGLQRATFATSVTPPEERPTDNQANLANVGPVPSIEFNIDRPWDASQINPNKEYPILASTFAADNVTSGNATDIVQLNKIIGCDIGWSYPQYSIVDSDNDTELAYESYVERKQLAFTPEFNTETLSAVVLLADGQHMPSLDSTPQRNRLEIRAAGTDYPGEGVSLTDSEVYQSNAYNISEDYKLDMRVHGRLLNVRITDNVAEANPNPTKFNSRTEWNVSGIQLEIMEDGRR